MVSHCNFLFSLCSKNSELKTSLTEAYDAVILLKFSPDFSLQESVAMIPISNLDFRGAAGAKRA